MHLHHQIGKRLIDICLSGTALLLLMPLLVIVAILVRWRLGAPILYWQQRPGLNGRLFWMVKFRTMTNECDASAVLLSDTRRLTPFGRFLRSTSLDELPELWNVLVGEMSLVGPRPLLMEYLDHYTPEQARRHAVKPGITGWAQVNGRNAISWEQKFRFDLWYVDHQSFSLDMRIMLQTVAAVFSRKGISAKGHATMPQFMGQLKDEGVQDAA